MVMFYGSSSGLVCSLSCVSCLLFCLFCCLCYFWWRISFPLWGWIKFSNLIYNRSSQSRWASCTLHSPLRAALSCSLRLWFSFLRAVLTLFSSSMSCWRALAEQLSSVESTSCNNTHIYKRYWHVCLRICSLNTKWHVFSLELMGAISYDLWFLHLWCLTVRWSYDVSGCSCITSIVLNMC